MAALNDFDFADFLGGDINGLDQIIQACKYEVYLIISEKVEKGETIEKLTTACFKAVGKNIGDFEDSKHIRHYLFKTARNKRDKAIPPGERTNVPLILLDSSHLEDLPAEELALSLDIIEARVNIEKWRKEAARSLQTLPTKRREIFRLIALEDMTPREVAKLNCISVNAVRKSYRLAKAELQKDLKKRGYRRGYGFYFMV